MFKLKWRWLAVKEWMAGPRHVIRVEGDTLPNKMPARDLVLLTEGAEEWSVAMMCPCGCGERVELPLIVAARPRWSLRLDSRGRPTLHPSIWRQDGCRSHYFIRAGKVVWA